MLIKRRLIIAMTLLVGGTAWAQAQDTIELETTIIKGNTELPKILYVVPWQDISEDKQGEQKLVLHSLFGDFFEPQMPEAPGRTFMQTAPQ